VNGRECFEDLDIDVEILLKIIFDNGSEPFTLDLNTLLIALNTLIRTSGSRKFGDFLDYLPDHQLIKGQLQFQLRNLLP
jgi:hypothetical protein